MLRTSLLPIPRLTLGYRNPDFPRDPCNPTRQTLFFQTYRIPLPPGFLTCQIFVNPESNNDRKDHSAHRRRQELSDSAIGYQILGTILVFAGLGYWIDRKLHWEPAGLIVGLILGCIAAIAAILKLGSDRDNRPPDEGTKSS